MALSQTKKKNKNCKITETQILFVVHTHKQENVGKDTPVEIVPL